MLNRTQASEKDEEEISIVPENSVENSATNAAIINAPTLPFQAYGTFAPALNSLNADDIDLEKGEGFNPKPKPLTNKEIASRVTLSLIAFIDSLGLGYFALGGDKKIPPAKLPAEFPNLTGTEKANALTGATSTVVVNWLMGTRFNWKASDKIQESMKENKGLGISSASLGSYAAVAAWMITFSGWTWAMTYVALPLATLSWICNAAKNFTGLIETAQMTKNLFDLDIILQKKSIELLEHLNPEWKKYAENFLARKGINHATFIELMQNLDAHYQHTPAALLQNQIHDFLGDLGLDESSYKPLIQKLEEMAVENKQKLVEIEKTLINYQRNDLSPEELQKKNKLLIEKYILQKQEQELIPKISEFLKEPENDNPYETDASRGYTLLQVNQFLTQGALSEIFTPKSVKEKIFGGLATVTDATLAISAAFIAFLIYGQKGLDGLLKIEELLGSNLIKNSSELTKFLACALPIGAIRGVFFGKQGADARATLHTSVSLLIEQVKKLPPTMRNLYQNESKSTPFIEALKSSLLILLGGVSGTGVFYSGKGLKNIGNGIKDNPENLYIDKLFPPLHEEDGTPVEDHPGNVYQHAVHDSFSPAAENLGRLVNAVSISILFNELVTYISPSHDKLNNLIAFEKKNALRQDQKGKLTVLSMFAIEKASKDVPKTAPESTETTKLLP